MPAVEALLPRFFAAHTQVLGVSVDSAFSHANWGRDLGGVSFPLLADSDGEVSTAYGVKTRMFGMTVAKRQTFIIDPDGAIAKHYETVKPDAHSAEVLADLKTLGAGP